MAQRILVIDPDVAFATLLKEGLEQTGQCIVTTVGDGAKPMDTLNSARFALVVLDMGLADPPALQVAQSLRTQQPHLPLMIIPLDGDTLPPEVSELNVQGVLTKPFFLPDLPGMVARAIKAQTQVTPSPSDAPFQEFASTPRSAPMESRQATCWEGHESELNRFLSTLARELNAEAILLTCGDDLIAHAGRFSRQDAEQVAHIIIESWHTSAKAARLLGREKVRFEQSMHEGGDYMLYSLSVSEDSILSMALHTNTPLGMIRYHAKQTAEAMSRLANRP